MDERDRYCRIGTDYFKVIEVPDRNGILRDEMKKWTAEAIKYDFGVEFLKALPKYNTFVLEPNNNGCAGDIGLLYNIYAKFPHKPKRGEWKWTEVMLKHIFKDQYDIALIYLKVLYEYPKQALPVLVLVSKERQTGKTTFINWLNAIFGKNMVQIEPDVIGGSFNGEYATANIIAIDETVVDKQIAVEKIKSLATKKYISVNQKHISHFTVPFFGKIILASNAEDKFMRIDSEEIRFWVRKVDLPKIKNHGIEKDMISEIPAFLHYLTTLPDIDFTQSRMVLTAEQIDNEFLQSVKEESKSWMYKEIHERLTDYFSENPSKEYVYARPTDIKDKFFSHNSKVEVAYIRKVLKNEFKFKISPANSYGMNSCIFNSFNGKPFKINADIFVEKTIEYIKDDDNNEPF